MKDFHITGTKSKLGDVRQIYVRLKRPDPVSSFGKRTGASLHALVSHEPCIQPAASPSSAISPRSPTNAGLVDGGRPASTPRAVLDTIEGRKIDADCGNDRPDTARALRPRAAQ
jgi:hypothetical protein